MRVSRELSVQTVNGKNLPNQSSSRRGRALDLDLILGECQRRTNTCFTQSLTYHNALGIIRERGFSTLALAETEDNELDLEKIEAQFRRCPGAICYLVPTYSNPCSDSLDIPTREALVGLALRL